MIALRPAELRLFTVETRTLQLEGQDVPVSRVVDCRRGGRIGPWCLEADAQPWWDHSETAQIMRGEIKPRS